ncbi:MAG: two-component system, chemotaxis family, sensor kinase CheA [Acidobacteriota bacterium]|nr:two-component system, chemotaxis family, sensor kinase CheA [Acidobacteriota bacterium]
MSNPNPDDGGEFFAQFLDDYFAECDEHLTLVRRHLLALEEQVGRPFVEPSSLDELFRSFHTLKGISAMVGLEEAEQLAHHMESFLRALRHAETPLDVEGVEALMAGTTVLEQVINAFRKKEMAASIDATVERLRVLVPEPASLAERPANVESVEAGVADTESKWTQAPQAARQTKDVRKWRFEFVPTPALSERGVNVNSVRARLQEIGELLQATPHVREQGGIVFEFIVSTGVEESLFAGWHEDNLTYTPVEEADAGQTRPPTSPVQTVPASGTTDVADGSASISTAPPASMHAPSNVVRVDLARLDELMRLIGELVTSRARLDDGLKHLKRSVAPAEWRVLQETSQAMARQLRDLREGVMHVRMVQVGEIFERMRFVVRDLARESGKNVKLELLGRETEIDKFLVERMMGPLLHLVRNAVSHGLETVEERVAQGKSPEGRLTLRASTAGDNVVIEIADDGRGIDAERVAVRARERGLIAGDVKLDEALLLKLICTPGFSTRDEADRASGRGVGMDVVGRTIEELGGTLALATEKNRGTHFTVELPLTLAIADALIGSVGGQRFALPQTAVREVIEVEASAVRVLENNEIVPYRKGVLPLVRLARLFGLEEKAAPAFHVFVIGSGANALGLVVERIIGQREIVVRGMNDPLVKVRGVAGATDLGDGRVVLILDVAALKHSVLGGELAAGDARG